MKQISGKSAVTATVLAVLTIPLRSSAQDPSATSQTDRHPRYKFVDLGTFGGPGSINTAFEEGVINSLQTEPKIEKGVVRGSMVVGLKIRPAVGRGAAKSVGASWPLIAR